MDKQRILVTGGAGFIGSNLVYQLLNKGHEVIVFDNLSRPGCERNVAWLRDTCGASSFRLEKADLSNFDALIRATQGVDRVYHLAGQVAVTTSVKEPRQDFEDNAKGTFNALEAARLVGNNPIFIYASTNKVYGRMDHVEIVERATRYSYKNLPFGVSETQPLDFHSPYGCSKGSADQYTRDYARIYGLRTVVVRQSCIYGYRQFGVEDQGWVAWFIIAAHQGRTISIFGDGKQVRDILFVDDLLSFYEAAVQNVDKTAGQIYNIGGGTQNTMSIWSEFEPLLKELIRREIPIEYEDWRPGDQQIYISDIRKAELELGWRPQISVHEGIARLDKWIRENLNLFDK